MPSFQLGPREQHERFSYRPCEAPVMKPDPHYNLVKCFLHATLPPSRNCWRISCVPTLRKWVFFQEQLCCTLPRRWSHLPPLHRAGPVPRRPPACRLRRTRGATVHTPSDVNGCALETELPPKGTKASAENSVTDSEFLGLF